MAMLESYYLDFSNRPRAQLYSWWEGLSQSILAKPVNLNTYFDWVSYYEGHSIQSITLPVRILKRLGVDIIIGITACLPLDLIYDVNRSLVTNAAGGLNANYAVGDIVVLNDVRLNINL